jgi:hypothetical protein
VWFVFSHSSASLTFVASHVIFPDKSNEMAVDSWPLGPLPQNKLDAILAKLRGHKHLFEAKATQGLLGLWPSGIMTSALSFVLKFL